MLLVAYLQMLADQLRPLDGAGRALLYPMIHSSNNEAATAVLAIVGEDGLDRLARDAHMVNYQSGGAFWGFTEVSAADLARFFFHQEALIPRQFEGYARWLLSTIEPSESWGIPAVARPEFQVFFKGGWLPEFEGLVNQVARLERPGIVFALAVLTIHDPSMAYGEQTIEGVTARLLGRYPRRALSELVRLQAVSIVGQSSCSTKPCASRSSSPLRSTGRYSPSLSSSQLTERSCGSTISTSSTWWVA
jgi:hypothetical protein